MLTDREQVLKTHLLLDVALKKKSHGVSAGP